MQKQEQMIRELYQWWLNTEEGERDLRIQQSLFLQHCEANEQFKQQMPVQQFKRFLFFLEKLAMQRSETSDDTAMGVKNVMEKGGKFSSSWPLRQQPNQKPLTTQSEYNQLWELWEKWELEKGKAANFLQAWGVENAEQKAETAALLLALDQEWKEWREWRDGSCSQDGTHQAESGDEVETSSALSSLPTQLVSPFQSITLQAKGETTSCLKHSKGETSSAVELEQKKALAMKLLRDRQAAERQQLYEKMHLLEEKLMAGEEESWREQLIAAQQQFATACMQLTERHIAQRKRLEAKLEGGETPVYAEEEEEVLPITSFVPFGYQLSEHETWIPLMEPTFDSYFAKTLEIKAQMCELFGDNSEKLLYGDLGGWDSDEWSRKELREKCGFGKYDDRSFLRILAVLVSMEKFRETYGLSLKLAFHFKARCEFHLNYEHSDATYELFLIWNYYNPGFKLEDIRDANEDD